MCRIAGIVQAGGAISEISDLVKRMCDVQKHGGPDDEGFFVSEKDSLVLGNRRLALLDLTPDGHMPMHYRERYCITYNGELYNYLSLKNELIELGHTFNNHTDTEVVIASFAQWNVQAFSKLEGMFAFALYDSMERELYLVRDAAGIKPLYYFFSNRQIAFSSEMRAMELVPWISKQDTNWPVYLMAYGFIPEPVTTLRNVKPLPKGCFLKYNIQRDQSTLQSYTHYSYTNEITTKEKAVAAIRKSVKDAVESHLLADAPLGVFLSGGIDSGIITSIASSYRKGDVDTLSIYFEEAQFSEKKYQDIVSQKVNSKHHNYLLRKEEFNESFISILNSMDMPSCDGINTWFISKHAASLGLKAVLSGVGGDELFGGYPSFVRLDKAHKLQQLPSFIKDFCKKSSLKKLNRMSYLKLEGIKGIYLFLRGHFSPYEIARHLGATEKQVFEILNDGPVFSDIDTLDTKNMASWMEFNLYMQNQLLRDSDIMSMIHSVEIRVPFLDDQVIRTALKIAPSVKYAGTFKKQILIDSFRDLLPEAVWNRPKMGFTFPFQQWLKSNQYVEETLNNSNSISKNSYSRFLKDDFHWSQILSLVLIEHNRRN